MGCGVCALVSGGSGSAKPDCKKEAPAPCRERAASGAATDCRKDAPVLAAGLGSAAPLRL
eukprot:5249764-Prymnesium_polylepis.1